jgi:hypothetical protein
MDNESSGRPALRSHDPDAGTLVEKRPNSVFQLFEHSL